MVTGMKYKLETITKKDLVLFDLANIVNTAEHETNDVIIAKAFLELRDEIDNWTQEQIARKYFVSQAGISRFIGKLGFSSFGQLKNSIRMSQMVIAKMNPAIQRDFQTASTEIRSQLMEVADSIVSLDQREIAETIRLIKEHDTIYFIGSELSMAICRLLQVKLIGNGKNVYTIYNQNYQNEILRFIRPSDLIVVLSMGQRWYKIYARDSLEKNRDPLKMLWTVKPDHEDRQLFRYVVDIGKTDDPNIGYHYLMQFVLLLYQMV